MKQAIVAGIGVALAAIGGAGEASAGVWRWGCMGSFGDKQILFTRYHLIVVPAQPSRGKLEDIIFLDDLAKDASDVEQYMAADINSGFTPTIEFTFGDDGRHTIALTEKSSKSAIASHRDGVRPRRAARRVSQSLSLSAQRRSAARHYAAMHGMHALDPRRAALHRPAITKEM